MSCWLMENIKNETCLSSFIIEIDPDPDNLNFKM